MGNRLFGDCPALPFICSQHRGQNISLGNGVPVLSVKQNTHSGIHGIPGAFAPAPQIHRAPLALSENGAIPL